MSDFKVADNKKYDISFKTSEYTRDTFKFLIGYELIKFYKDPTEAYRLVTDDTVHLSYIFY